MVVKKDYKTTLQLCNRCSLVVFLYHYFSVVGIPTLCFHPYLVSVIFTGLFTPSWMCIRYRQIQSVQIYRLLCIQVMYCVYRSCIYYVYMLTHTHTYSAWTVPYSGSMGWEITPENHLCWRYMHSYHFLNVRWMLTNHPIFRSVW